MELIAYGKKRDSFLLNCFPQTIKNGVLTYFIYSKGYLKTKAFNIVNGITLPERYDKLSWLDICKIHEKYGIEVSNNYAECKTAGLVSRQTILGKYKIYSIIKDILPENDDSFFDLLKCEYFGSCFGLFSFDIIGTDDNLSKNDKEYDNVKCTYKGKENVSMNEYISEKYGFEYNKIIDKLLLKMN